MMLVNEESLFGEDLFGLGQLPADIYGGYGVLFQMRDSRGAGMAGVKLRLMHKGQVYDESTSDDKGLVALFAPRSATAPLESSVYIVGAPLGYYIPTNAIHVEKVAAGAKPYFDDIRDRKKIILDSFPSPMNWGIQSYIPYDLSMSVHVQERQTQMLQQQAAEAEAAAKYAADERLRLEEEALRIREQQAVTTSEVERLRLEKEALEKEKAAREAAERELQAKEAAKKLEEAMGKGGLDPILIAGAAIVAGVGLYLLFSKA